MELGVFRVPSLVLACRRLLARGAVDPAVLDAVADVEDHVSRAKAGTDTVVNPKVATHRCHRAKAPMKVIPGAGREAGRPAPARAAKLVGMERFGVVPAA